MGNTSDNDCIGETIGESDYMNRLNSREAELERLKQLHAEGLNDCEIARKLGVPRGRIYYRRKVMLKLPNNSQKGCPRKSRFIPSSELIKLYKQGLTNREIGDRLGVTRSAIWHRLKQLNLSSNFLSTGLKFGKLKESFINLYLLTDSRGSPSLTGKQIAKKLKISMATVWKWQQQLNLPIRFQKCKRNAQLFNSRCYHLRKKGLTDYEIAEKLSVREHRVKIGIGRYLIGLCRQSPSCPYKALLPEGKV